MISLIVAPSPPSITWSPPRLSAVHFPPVVAFISLSSCRDPARLSSSGPDPSPPPGFSNPQPAPREAADAGGTTPLRRLDWFGRPAGWTSLSSPPASLRLSLVNHPVPFSEPFAADGPLFLHVFPTQFQDAFPFLRNVFRWKGRHATSLTFSCIKGPESVGSGPLYP